MVDRVENQEGLQRASWNTLLWNALHPLKCGRFGGLEWFWLYWKASVVFRTMQNWYVSSHSHLDLLVLWLESADVIFSVSNWSRSEARNEMAWRRLLSPGFRLLLVAISTRGNLATMGFSRSRFARTFFSRRCFKQMRRRCVSAVDAELEAAAGKAQLLSDFQASLGSWSLLNVVAATCRCHSYQRQPERLVLIELCAINE